MVILSMSNLRASRCRANLKRACKLLFLECEKENSESKREIASRLWDLWYDIDLQIKKK